MWKIFLTKIGYSDNDRKVILMISNLFFGHAHLHAVYVFVVIFCQCPDSSSKNDLIAYIQRIALYSHQLTITARVKADVQMISGELVVSGVS